VGPGFGKLFETVDPGINIRDHMFPTLIDYIKCGVQYG
jgi:hypothetical protein